VRILNIRLFYMTTRKKKRTKTLTKRMTDYIFLKGDLCCEEDYEKDKIVDYIINNYKRIYPNDYLDWISNDIVKYIGYKSILAKENDKKGLRLWNELDKLTSNISENELRQIIIKFPLYFLLSFLGTSVYLNENSM